MFKQNQQSKTRGAVDGGEGRGIPLGGHDEPDDDELDPPYEVEEDEGADRRRDPLRKI